MGQPSLSHARTPGPTPGAAGPARARRALLALGAVTLLILSALLALSSSAGAHGGASTLRSQTRPRPDEFPELSQVFPAHALGRANHSAAQTAESSQRLLSVLLAHVDR